MINKENRYVALGDGDVKVAMCEIGIMFGDKSVPDNNVDEMEQDYMFGIQLTPCSIKPINEMLSKMENEENNVLDIGGTTIEFRNKEAIKEIKKVIAAWCKLLFDDVKTLQEYYDTTLKGQVE